MSFALARDNVDYYSRTLGNVKGNLMGSGDKFTGGVPGLKGIKKSPEEESSGLFGGEGGI